MSKETGKITEVTEHDDSFTVSQNRFCCSMSREYGVVPKVGDDFTVHTKGGTFGTIRGMDLNGVPVFWKTDEELETERLNWLKKNEEDKREGFAKNKDVMDAQYNALPKCFQERIDRFRVNNTRFRIDYEAYELFCCEEAVVIANSCKTSKSVEEFQSKGWDEQRKQIPKLSNEHSGNTFAAACALAYMYLDEPKNVPKMHGALSVMVGSEEYGDIPKNN